MVARLTRSALRQRHAGPSILDAMEDPHLFKPWFRDPQSWAPWRAFLSALFALEMTDAQLATFQKHTGRNDPPSQVARAAWLICGRRAGKSFTLALVAVFLACFYDYRQYLVPGERGVVLVIARDREQAQVIFNYIRALITEVPILARMIDGAPVKESIHLTNRVSIQVATASFKSVRGRTTVAALIDELAYFPTDESAEPDVELLAAIKPSMLTIPTSMLLVASSPYARKGELWRAYKDYYGKDGSTLIWKATTREMNALVPQEEIDADLARDRPRYSAEYLAEFRDDIQALVSRDVVEACVASGVRERPYVRGIRYTGFVDPSGGGSDSMTLAIAHRQGEDAVLDAIREVVPPFSPESVVEQFSALLLSYGISRITGDRYAGEWPRERFLKFGVTYVPNAEPKSALYSQLLPLLNGKRADLLDHEKMVNQIAGLERRVARGGRDSIDHAPNSHDDIANVVAGALTGLVATKSSYTLDHIWENRPDPRVGSNRGNGVELLANIETQMTTRFR